jgi:hypothetical protein
MLLTLVSDYKTEERPYVNGFVHSRVLSYIAQGVPTEVFVLNGNRKKIEYKIEGVIVHVGNVEDLCILVTNKKVKNICVHFLCAEMINFFTKCKHPLNLLIFVHGNEALHWYQRIFPGIFSSARQFLGFIKYVFVNTYEIRKIRSFFKKTHHNCTFVTVSHWMKEAAEKAWNCKGLYEWNIIPNIIDSTRFAYIEKQPDFRFHLLSIRPFSSGKYANDITAKLIEKLSEKPFFPKIDFKWIGAGRLYKSCVKPVQKFKNVFLENRMLTQKEIPGYHKQSGIFICPTRQDAQGVSMCEAMMSGLIPITLYNTAIPEFLPDNSLLICHSVDDMASLIERLISDPQLFVFLSKECSTFIKNKCDYMNTTKKEINLVMGFA